MDESQIRHFLERGYVVIRGCVPRQTAAQAVAEAWKRIGWDPARPKTWKEPRVCLPPTGRHFGRGLAPGAWDAIFEMVGGRDRLPPEEIDFWPDTFIVKFPRGTGVEWVPPSDARLSWHKDGGPDKPHFLDSAEMGLVTFLIWTDIAPKGGGTFFACDSVPLVARHLAAHPEGARLDGEALNGILKRCRDFVEITGEAGDAVLVHPYMLHAESENVAGSPRFQTARLLRLKEPMRFDRRESSEFSLVELSVLRALGRKRLSFRRR